MAKAEEGPEIRDRDHMLLAERRYSLFRLSKPQAKYLRMLLQRQVAVRSGKTEIAITLTNAIKAMEQEVSWTGAETLFEYLDEIIQSLDSNNKWVDG